VLLPRLDGQHEFGANLGLLEDLTCEQRNNNIFPIREKEKADTLAL
jgi:hypothetical protein